MKKLRLGLCVERQRQHFLCHRKKLPSASTDSSSKSLWQSALWAQAWLAGLRDAQGSFCVLLPWNQIMGTWEGLWCTSHQASGRELRDLSIIPHVNLGHPTHGTRCFLQAVTLLLALAGPTWWWGHKLCLPPDVNRQLTWLQSVAKRQWAEETAFLCWAGSVKLWKAMAGSCLKSCWKVHESMWYPCQATTDASSGCALRDAGPAVAWHTFPLTYIRGIHESHIKKIIYLMNRLLLLRWWFQVTC